MFGVVKGSVWFALIADYKWRGFFCILPRAADKSLGIYIDVALAFIIAALPCYIIKPCPDFQLVKYS